MGAVCHKVTRVSGREDPTCTLDEDVEPDFDRESGCYLVFLDGHQGTLVMQWSETVVKDALAVFYPQAPIPKHKFTTNGGRVELSRQGNNKRKYLEVICQFVKTAKQLKATLVMRTEAVSLYVHDKDDQVMLVKEGMFKELANADLAVVVPKDACEFRGVSKMNKTHLISKAAQVGVSLSL
eukprot:TRINITY_DN71592_c0_g1_i1.p1 TRINITY_DN71592_c0_g1~~TRINITY_DN71592_c0_g1_i1.p1  ORF type:complete len:199 (-),score=24.04 TRINITY_DN71592_c0_g1_i1:160-702(-)